MAEEASPSGDQLVYNTRMGRDGSGVDPTEAVPEEPGDRLARLLAQPLDRRTFLALSALAVPALLEACAAPPSPTGPPATASQGVPSNPSGSASSIGPSQEVADWVFVGGAVLTMEGGRRAEGIAIRGEPDQRRRHGRGCPGARRT